MPCEQIYSNDRCLAMVDVAAAEVTKNRGDVAAVGIVPDPPPDGATLGGAWPIRVRIVLKDGSTHESRMCGGVSIDPACSPEPHLNPGSIIGGYHDLPCGPDPEPDGPEDCATPLPTLEPDATVEATPILIDASTIPIDHVGQYEVSLGEGSLANGVLREASF